MKKASGRGFVSPGASAPPARPPRKAPQQARAQATVEAILDATLQVLLSDGGARLTTTRIAHRAGVSVGTLYQYFPEKRSIVAALKRRYVEGMADAVDASIRASADLPAFTRVEHVVRALLAYKVRHHQASAAMRSVPDTPQDFRAVENGGARLVEAAAALVASAQPRRGDPGLSARVLVGAIEGALQAVVEASPSRLASPELEAELVRLASGYLGVPGPDLGRGS